MFTILFQQNTLQYFQGEVVLTSVFLINRMSSQTLHEHTLVSVLSPHREQYFISSHICCCLYFVHNLCCCLYGIDINKLDHRSIKVFSFVILLSKKKISVQILLQHNTLMYLLMLHYEYIPYFFCNSPQRENYNSSGDEYFKKQMIQFFDFLQY